MISRTRPLLGLVIAIVCSMPSAAQPVGACQTGTAQRFLANGELQVSVFNTGGLFFGGSTTSGDGYLIPKDSGTSPLFAAGFWLGGTIDGELRVAAARYGNYTFWPGPLIDAADPPLDCSAHDRIYVVSRRDLLDYYATGEATDDLRDWPVELGAPVLDGDGIEGNYDLAGGDQPDLVGDQAAWWVMNDAGNAHPATASTLPMGVEVRVLAFVYGRTNATSSPALSQTTFLRYEIINRGDRPIEQMHASIFADPDLGDAGDDYIGTDTLRHLVFVYNDSNEDAVYGIPPAWGIQVLSGPVGLANGRDDDRDGEVDEPGERLGATATSTFISGGPDGTQDPGTAEQYYNYMQGLWGDGTPITAFGLGYQTDGPVTRFFYSGDPVMESFWSEVNNNGNGQDSDPGDRRMVVSTGPFELGPGASMTLFFATPFGQGSDYLQSVRVLQGRASALQSVHRAGFLSSRPVEVRRPDPAFELTLSRVRPNPSMGSAEVLLTLPDEAPVEAVVYDALGRRVAVVVEGRLPEGGSVLSMPRGLAVGTYVLRVRVAPGGEQTLTFSVVR